VLQQGNVATLRAADRSRARIFLSRLTYYFSRVNISLADHLMEHAFDSQSRWMVSFDLMACFAPVAGAFLFSFP
jgi:hypothetical protein